VAFKHGVTNIINSFSSYFPLDSHRLIEMAFKILDAIIILYVHYFNPLLSCNAIFVLLIANCYSDLVRKDDPYQIECFKPKIFVPRHLMGSLAQIFIILDMPYLYLAGNITNLAPISIIFQNLTFA
jgi:hypothetical protein